MNYDELSIEEKEFVDELIFFMNLYKRNSISISNSNHQEIYELGAKAKLYTRRMKGVYSWLSYARSGARALTIRSSATGNTVRTYFIPREIINI